MQEFTPNEALLIRFTTIIGLDVNLISSNQGFVDEVLKAYQNNITNPSKKEGKLYKKEQEIKQKEKNSNFKFFPEKDKKKNEDKRGDSLKIPISKLLEGEIITKRYKNTKEKVPYAHKIAIVCGYEDYHDFISASKRTNPIVLTDEEKELGDKLIEVLSKKDDNAQQSTPNEQKTEATTPIENQRQDAISEEELARLHIFEGVYECYSAPNITGYSHRAICKFNNKGEGYFRHIGYEDLKRPNATIKYLHHGNDIRILLKDNRRQDGIEWAVDYLQVFTDDKRDADNNFRRYAFIMKGVYMSNYSEIGQKAIGTCIFIRVDTPFEELQPHYIHIDTINGIISNNKLEEKVIVEKYKRVLSFFRDEEKALFSVNLFNNLSKQTTILPEKERLWFPYIKIEGTYRCYWINPQLNAISYIVYYFDKNGKGKIKDITGVENEAKFEFINNFIGEITSYDYELDRGKYSFEFVIIEKAIDKKTNSYLVTTMKSVYTSFNIKMQLYAGKCIFIRANEMYEVIEPQDFIDFNTDNKFLKEEYNKVLAFFQKIQNDEEISFGYKIRNPDGIKKTTLDLAFQSFCTACYLVQNEGSEAEIRTHLAEAFQHGFGRGLHAEKHQALLKKEVENGALRAYSAWIDLEGLALV
ncbi:MAG: hypothetical protein EAZ08_01370 [Cytophagales bacterium]|nr:MAG: hypothetical protein EAZ08_01370 [Cytophagales bacterium]